MSRFMDARLGKIEEYVPGEQPRDMQYVKLNTNELPYPPSPLVLERINREETEKLRLYSDPDCRALKEELASHYGVGYDNIFVGNGSDEVLNFAFMAYGAGGVLFPDITYGFYRVFGDLYGIACTPVPLTEDFRVDIRAYTDCGKTVVLANPNAPTGIALSVAEIEQIVKSNPAHPVIIDEAYVDFGAGSAVPLTETYENLLVVGTFSKSRALAGARVGFGIGNQDLIRDLNRIKNTTNPYNINRLSMAAACAALDSQDYFDEKCRQIAETREQTKQALRELGFFVTDSAANFLFASHPRISGKQLYLSLKDRGILVRHFDTERIREYVRITVGTPEQMRLLLQNIRDILAETEAGR